MSVGAGCAGLAGQMPNCTPEAVESSVALAAAGSSPRAEVAAIKEIMFTTPLSSERGYVPRQMSEEDGAKLARRILSLFTDVMGGLQ